VGIAKENLEHVCQRYYRGDKNHRRSIAGSGLGLSIVREILDLHNARYGVLSTPGEGSTFWFELPVENEKLLIEQV
jgi:signal transduction histidine kinase